MSGCPILRVLCEVWETTDTCLSSFPNRRGRREPEAFSPRILAQIDGAFRPGSLPLFQQKAASSTVVLGTLPFSPVKDVDRGSVFSGGPRRFYCGADVPESFFSPCNASASSGGFEGWSLLISLAPSDASTGVTLMPVAMAPEVHLK